MTEAILITKLHQPVANQESIILRQRLKSQLDNGLEKSSKLTLISAPAGFGKTTLSSQWAAEQEGRTAWLSLDKWDNEPIRFWRYFIAAIQTIHDNIGVSVQAYLDSGQVNPNQIPLTSLINELSNLTSPLILILDDYHVISNTTIHEKLNYLIENIASNFHLVIITRADPPLPIAKWRAQGLLNEIRGADLRFSSQESTSYLNQIMSLDLAQKDIELLKNRTEGWIAGLQLAAISLMKLENKSAFIKDFAGSHQYILEYLTEDVIMRQPQAIQDFLLKTSLLDQFCAPICNTISDQNNSEDTLQQLIKSNLFLIPLDNNQHWYRYHHLFAELLQYQLRQKYTSHDIAALHNKASRWYEENNQISEAIHHTLQAKDCNNAIRLLEDHWQNYIHQGEPTRLKNWLDALPTEIIQDNAPIHMGYCWIYYLTGQFKLFEYYLDQAYTSLKKKQEQGNIPQKSAWLIMPSLVETMSATLAHHQGRLTEGIQHAQTALQQIPKTEDLEGAALLRGAAAFRLGRIYQELGELEKAATVLSEVLEYLKIGQNLIGIVHTTSELTQIYTQTNQLETAKNICEDVLQYIHDHNQENLPIAGRVHLALAEVFRLQSNIPKTRNHLNKALHISQTGDFASITRQAQQSLSTLDQNPTNTLIEKLSSREIEVLQLISEGLSNQEIAQQLTLTINTVKKHTKNIYRKLDVSNRTKAIIRGRELKIIS